MKLTNPTDQELNEAFALHVAKWTFSLVENPSRPGARWWSDENGSLVDTLSDPDFNIFTTSADAVLPWLEKWREDDPDYRACTMSLSSDGCYHVELRGFDEPNQYAKHAILAKVIVAVLLRANGAEIELTP